MKRTINVLLAFIALFVICGCDNVEKKINKAYAYYESNGYEIKHGLVYDAKRPFLLVEKNNTFYLDTVFKKNGKSAVRIFPKKNGMKFKTLEVSVKKGFNEKIRPVEVNDLFSSATELGGNGDDIFRDCEASIALPYTEFNNKKTLLWGKVQDKYFYYFVGDEEAWVFDQELYRFDDEYYILEKTFTFADLNLPEEYDYDMFDNSLEDYPFVVQARFSKEDLSFLGFSDIKIEKSQYPWESIVYRLGKDSQLEERGIFLCFPTSWIGTNNMNTIKECIDEDLIERYNDMRLSQELRWYEEEEARQREEAEAAKQAIFDKAIDFQDMVKDYNNPIKADTKYTSGMDMILMITMDEISYSSGSSTYVLLKNGLVDDAVIYTNDPAFAELDYPQVVVIKTKFTSRYEDYFGSVTYKFSDAELLYYKKPGLFDW